MLIQLVMEDMPIKMVLKHKKLQSNFNKLK